MLVVLACVAGNVVATARRTLVPVRLAARLVSKERLAEKHEGVDDVVLWHLDDGTTIQVEPTVDELAGRGARLEKAAGDGVLRVDGRPVSLPPSDDARGMLLVAVPVALAALVLAVAAVRRRPATGTVA